MDKYIKEIWQDYRKALTFTKGNTLNDLVKLYNLIKKGKQIAVSSLKIRGKTQKQIADLITRLKRLGEVYDPMLGRKGENKYIKKL